MSTKLLHIGLPKCGTTFLRNEIFPEIEKKMKIEHLTLSDVLNKKKYYTYRNKIKLKKKLPKSFILSSERLFSRGGEFLEISKSFKYIKKNFSKDTVILIVLRNPYEFLNSIYCQAIQTMNIIRPEDFFYIKKNSKIRKDGGKYNLYKFDYNYFVALYKSYFKKVIVVKYENLNNYVYLKKIFNLDAEFINQLKNKSNIHHNKSISKTTINLVLSLNKFINFKNKQNLLKNYTKNIYVDGSKKLNPKPSFLKKFQNGLLKKLIILKFFFQHKFLRLIDKIFVYKKYYIKKNYIPLNVDKLIKDYNKTTF